MSDYDVSGVIIRFHCRNLFIENRSHGPWIVVIPSRKPQSTIFTENRNSQWTAIGRMMNRIPKNHITKIESVITTSLARPSRKSFDAVRMLDLERTVYAHYESNHHRIGIKCNRRSDISWMQPLPPGNPPNEYKHLMLF